MCSPMAAASTALAENNFRARGGARHPARHRRQRLQRRRRLSSTPSASTRRTTPTPTASALTASLIWDITPDHRLRVAYTYDRAHHRQTGEWGFLEADGNPESVFSGRNATPGARRERLPDPAARPHLDRPAEPVRRPVYRPLLRRWAARRARPARAVLQARSADLLPDPGGATASPIARASRSCARPVAA